MSNRRFIFSVIVVLVLVSAVLAQHKDYSSKGDAFAILRNIRLDVVRIEPVGAREISVEGKVLLVSAFDVVTRVAVPFLEGRNPYNNVLKDVDIRYELMVGEDRDSFIHNKLINVLAEISRSPAAERDFENVGLNGLSGRYLIYSGPVSMPSYIWYDGRVVAVRFVRISDRRKDIPFNTEVFRKEKIRFYPNGEKLTLSSVPKSFAADFLKRKDAGEFQRPK